MKFNALFVLALALPIAQSSLSEPTVPTECTSANEGRCQCGDTSKGFTTYTFWLDGVQRCFTVFRPIERATEKLPILVYSHCYSKDRLTGINMANVNSDWNKAAARYGFARIGISTPDTNWVFGNNGIVNDTIPMACSDDDSKDMKYVRVIVSWIAANQDMFDTSKIWTHGFSQNAMFSAYIGYCFSDYVTGVWQGGSGMALTGLEPSLPGCQGQVSASVYESCRADNMGCKICKSKFPCTECQYWPIYPCYSPTKPMVGCLQEYTNDFISNGKKDPDASSATYMYDRLKNEGHDARLLRFAPSADGTIKGTHKEPRNSEYWTIGCLGMAPSCTESCEPAFKSCVESLDISTAAKRAASFKQCMSSEVLGGLEGCSADCAPTFNMLAESETPSEFEFENFGAGTGVPESRPETSLCNANDFTVPCKS